MTENLLDTRKTILTLMDVTRRHWQVRRQGPRGRDGEIADHAWPTGDGPAFRQDGKLERFLREQERG